MNLILRTLSKLIGPLLFALIAFPQLATASEVFFGIVGIGPGNGVLGHAFLLIRQTAKSFIMADYYQFNLKLSNGEPIPEKGLNLDFNSMQFTLDHRIFADVLSAYTDKNDRSVYLYQLNLNEGEIADLSEKLKATEALNGSATIGSYGILANNCATKLVDILNSVVSPEKQISLAKTGGSKVNGTSGVINGIRDAFLDRAPFYLAMVLENHPISHGRSRVFERRTQTQIKLYSSLLKEMNSLSLNCKWDPTTAKSVKDYAKLSIGNLEKFPTDPIARLANRTCQNQNDQLLDVFLIMYQLIPDRETDAAKTFFEQISRLSNRTGSGG
jgi:hypothetical protein